MDLVPQPDAAEVRPGCVAAATETIMIDGGRRLTTTDVLRKHSLINARRTLTDEDIRATMHSARPKQHEVDVHKPNDGFVPSSGLSSTEASELLQTWGKNSLEERGKPTWRILLDQFTQPMPVAIWVAIVVEAALQDWEDVGVLCALQAINGLVGFHETMKAGSAVAALKASLKPQAHAKRDGVWTTMDAALLVPGDLVLLGSGGAVPADCIINDGQIDVDQAALTGESLPVTMGKLDNPKMGSTVTRGEVEATVESTGMNTFFGKTASLIQSVEGMGHLAKILLGIMLVILLISGALCLATLGYLLAEGESFKSTISFVVVLLVASIPIALEVVVTATMALGSLKLADMHAIVARLSAVEELASMDMLCSDKTGTLTLNKMVIQEDCPMFQEGVARDDVILLAALAAKWREPPKDALDTMVLGVAPLGECDAYQQLEYTPFDPALKRTEAALRHTGTGETFRVTKGAPHVVLALCHDQDRIAQAVDFKVMELAERGIRSLAVAKTDEQDRWCMQGILTFLDPPREDTRETIERAHVYGIDVKMLTGDHAAIARETARSLGMGTNILGCEGLPTLGPNGELPANLGDTLGRIAEGCNGFAQVFPEHKFLIVESLRQRGFHVGMTGDGVNDAPALKKADVGIAVQGATDAARAAADIILTLPGLSVVIEAIVISRCIFARMRSFIIYRVASSLQLVVFFFIAVLALHPDNFQTPANPVDPGQPTQWPVAFSMPVIALILITVLNDGPVVAIAYDNVVPNHKPDKWNMRAIYLVSSVLGAIACVSSLLLLYLGLRSGSADSVWAKWGLAPLSYESVVCMMWLKVSLSSFLTVMASRTTGFFWQVRPSLALMCAFAVAVGAATALALTWPLGQAMKPIDGSTCGLTWVYCVVWFLIQDAVKVVVYGVMRHYNLFNFNEVPAVAEHKNRREVAEPERAPVSAV